ncbi:maleylpyruvate isomerase N-terminal domain-containing protein [Mesoterricola sediminis]|uniref:Mycothiol-dependent maleylpyruvate isomerase metal-binding domain-containing protein n=1 Tax=Mesoterricola sediminis TaxID=2927980 RepID=A0AA48GYG1_9BACT|nr:maleylpyruvate isomerase N-terminal domain-containing protein [Mesoterricola sediminis]BDU78584.1 hypothetical protein METESE_35420 [Mesoterricola sediminis]
MASLPPTLTAHLFRPLHDQLMDVLGALPAEAWRRPTVCGPWTVKDLAAHMLDTQLRLLSHGRDAEPLPPPDRPIAGYGDLVAFLDGLNAAWVDVARRLSPRVILDLLAAVGPQLADHLQAQDPEGPALFPVAWAGETASAAWFDMGRNYTEYWLHQQQIREAVGAPVLAGRAWLHPVLELFIRALPRTYGPVTAPEGTALAVAITGPAGGTWHLVRAEDGWRLDTEPAGQVRARIELTDDAAWRLFSKGLKGEEARRRVRIDGDAALGAPFLSALAIMG